MSAFRQCAVCGSTLPEHGLSVVGRGIVVDCCEREDDRCRQGAKRIWAWRANLADSLSGQALALFPLPDGLGTLDMFADLS